MEPIARRPVVVRSGLQIALLAVLVGASAVWAAVRQVEDRESRTVLIEAATAHEHTSYAGDVVWNGPFIGKGFGMGKSFGVRHDAESGRTAYRMGLFREWTVTRPSSRMPDPAAWCLAADSVGRNYRAEETGTDEYLGRPVRVLRVRPLHRGRPSLEVWMDRETNLPLKVITYRPDGSLYRVAKFSRIRFGAQVVDERQLYGAYRFMGTRVSLDDPQDSAGFRPLIPDFLPEGFRLVDARVKQRATPELTLLYSDGATAFELSQSPLATPAVLEAYHRTHMGKFGVRRMMDRHMKEARRRLVETNSGPAPGGSEDRLSGARDRITCRQWSDLIHTTHELRIGDLELKLTARSDIDREPLIQVLRSLRRR